MFRQLWKKYVPFPIGFQHLEVKAIFPLKNSSWNKQRWRIIIQVNFYFIARFRKLWTKEIPRIWPSSITEGKTNSAHPLAIKTGRYSKNHYTCRSVIFQEAISKQSVGNNREQVQRSTFDQINGLVVSFWSRPGELLSTNRFLPLIFRWTCFSNFFIVFQLIHVLYLCYLIIISILFCYLIIISILFCYLIIISILFCFVIKSPPVCSIHRYLTVL